MSVFLVDSCVVGVHRWRPLCEKQVLSALGELRDPSSQWRL